MDSKKRYQISRGTSFLIIGVIYAIAAAAGILIYRGLPGFDEYKAETRMLLPVPKKSSH